MEPINPTWTYSAWDGSENLADFDAESLLEASAEDLLKDGDVNLALQRMFRWGMHGDKGRIPGLRDLLQKLRRQREDELKRHDIGSILKDIQRRLDEIVDVERQGISRRQEMLSQPHQQGESGETGDAGEGQEQQGLTPEQRERLASMLADRSAQLDRLPTRTPDQFNALRDYEFTEPKAREMMEQLRKELEQQVAQSLFSGMQQSMEQMMGGQGGDDMASLLRDLNEALENPEGIDFDALAKRWGQALGKDINSLEDLLRNLAQRMMAAQRMLQSMSADQRRQLSELMDQVLDQAGLREQVQRLQQNLARFMPPEMFGQPPSFEGDEPISMEMAVDVMERASEIEQLERQLREVTNWDDLASIDQKMLDRVLSEEDQAWVRRWQNMTAELEETGLVQRDRRGLRLTPRAIRKIGEKALDDIFRQLKKDRTGQHELHHKGGGGEPADTTTQWEFGSPFLLNLPRTIMNAVTREGAGRAVKLRADDFEVYDTELRSQTATVLLIDMSRSMLYNGCWDSAKRAAIALDTLIRGKYPRDMLEIVGFSATAHKLKITDLPTLEWNEYNFGTNLQHGLEVSRQLLARSSAVNKQIIVITDGEPTAYFDHGEVQFHYPPTEATFEATLREVVRCTRERITINTFTLERTPYMIKFVNDLMRINHGRVIAASPDHLGSYMLTDYLGNRRVHRGDYA